MKLDKNPSGCLVIAPETLEERSSIEIFCSMHQKQAAVVMAINGKEGSAMLVVVIGPDEHVEKFSRDAIKAKAAGGYFDPNLT